MKSTEHIDEDVLKLAKRINSGRLTPTKMYVVAAIQVIGLAILIYMVW